MSRIQPLNHDRASPETLAGVYVCMEGREQVLVQPKKSAASAVASNASRAEPKKSNGAKPRSHQAKKKR